METRDPHLRRWYWGIALTLLLAMGAQAGRAIAVAQIPIPASAQVPSTSREAEPLTAEESVYQPFFSDVLVRGRPIFQVGGLGDLSATERAAQINRRLAGFLNQTQPLDPVQVRFNEADNRATLQVNNRVIMTVTAQDALDFDTPVAALANQWADRLNQVLIKPSLALDVAQRLQGTSQQLLRDLLVNLPSVVGALLVVGITWGVALGVRQAALLWAEQTEGDRNTELLIGRLCYGTVWVLGSVIALGVLGFNFSALIGTLGLTSVAIGFSLKDVLGNYISGVILLAARPFRIRDQVVIGSYEGTVIQIQLRATTVQTYDGRMVYIPNQEVFQSSITNNTASPVRRSSLIVGVDYGADIDQAKQVIQLALQRVDGVEDSPAPRVLVHELAASTVNLEVLFWVNSRRQSFLQVTSDVAQATKEALQAAAIEMPTDMFTLMFRQPLPPELGGSPGDPVPQEEIR